MCLHGPTLIIILKMPLLDIYSQSLLLKILVEREVWSLVSLDHQSIVALPELTLPGRRQSIGQSSLCMGRQNLPLAGDTFLGKRNPPLHTVATTGHSYAN